MGDVSPSKQAFVAHLLNAANQDSSVGVTAQTARDQERYWTAWEWICTLFNVDRYFQGVPRSDQINILQCFTRLIREGFGGRGVQVGVGSVEKALRAVGKKFTMDCKQDPTKQSPHAASRHIRLQTMIDAYI